MINMMNKNFPEKYLQYLFNDKVIFHFTDPLYYIKTTSKKYDSVILNLPEITDISVNKLFTEEFFTYIKNILTDNGIFAFNITSSESFLEKDLKERNNSVYKTLKPVFNNILIINGERNIFISSKNNSCKLSAENI